ncbi:hypothetical protein KIW84_072773 [Lathyrus oleraceus]|uniref:non-specific serine/threonine protein kinase n=1 Tax=Pisum sativum TaxID=3888 RepID=A0A9D4VLW5_PEA|nr:hypothetical protein KIW84_072773 [Pisum sativum]
MLNSLLLLLLTFSFCSCSYDSISIHKSIRDGELLISKSKTFALGFFTPGKSTSRYVGIWYYNLSIPTVVWVANRYTTINDTSGILSIDPSGNLVLHHNLSTIPIWSTNVSLPPSLTNNINVVIAQVSDIANLVLKLNNTETILWESFDHPTDTFLPYQRFGYDRKNNKSWFFQSWKTDEDPGKGAFTVKFSTIGKPQLVMYNRNFPWWRCGPWNGALIVGLPNMKRDMIVLQQSGFFKAFTWDSQESQWNQYRRDGSGGCIRRKGVSVCGNGEGFVKIVNLKAPDTSVAVAKGGLSLEECEKECLRNCSCAAYAPADVRNGGSGCLAWYGGLMDIQKLSNQGQDLFLLANYYTKSNGALDKKRLAAYLVASIVAIVFLVSYKMMQQSNQDSSREENGAPHPNLPFFNFKTIMTATRNCGHENKPGQDLNQRLSMDWSKRSEIICGIARGVLLLYLHQDSRLKIIHRDLKASKVLLDAAMNPKISDFGMARIFGEDEIQARTKRLVGTYGYMAPEYAMEELYSTKSDVFSYGVLLLEIIAGQRNTHCETGRASLNLIGHTVLCICRCGQWTPWTEGKALDTVDPTLNQSYPPDIVLRCIQIGLLCVQEKAMNRPSMLEVVFMLCNETPLCQPQKPAVLFNGSQDWQESTSGGGSSINEVTETSISARQKLL